MQKLIETNIDGMQGGFVQHCRNGVWRLQGSLSVSRAIGDQHLKEWVISEPEIKKIRLTSDCEFLVVASDGLWDKVRMIFNSEFLVVLQFVQNLTICMLIYVQVEDQEAVNVVLRENDSLKSCKKLVNMSSSRGSMDDITVMVINLQNFLATDHFQ